MFSKQKSSTGTTLESEVGDSETSNTGQVGVFNSASDKHAVITSRGGFHLLELHTASFGGGLGAVIAIVLFAVLAIWIYKRCRKTVTQPPPMYDSLAEEGVMRHLASGGRRGGRGRGR